MSVVLQPGIPVTVSRETWQGLIDYQAKHTGRGVDTSSTTFNPDGTLTIILSQQVMDRLKTLSPDPETAIRKSIGLKSN